MGISHLVPCITQIAQLFQCHLSPQTSGGSGNTTPSNQIHVRGPFYIQDCFSDITIKHEPVCGPHTLYLCAGVIYGTAGRIITTLIILHHSLQHSKPKKLCHLLYAFIIKCSLDIHQ